MLSLEYKENEGHREMIKRVWEEKYGSGSISEEEIQTIIQIGWAIMKRTEYCANVGFEASKEVVK